MMRAHCHNSVTPPPGDSMSSGSTSPKQAAAAAVAGSEVTGDQGITTKEGPPAPTDAAKTTDATGGGGGLDDTDSATSPMTVLPPAKKSEVTRGCTSPSTANTTPPQQAAEKEANTKAVEANANASVVEGGNNATKEDFCKSMSTATTLVGSRRDNTIPATAIDPSKSNATHEQDQEEEAANPNAAENKANTMKAMEENANASVVEGGPNAGEEDSAQSYYSYYPQYVLSPKDTLVKFGNNSHGLPSIGGGATFIEKIVIKDRSLTIGEIKRIVEEEKSPELQGTPYEIHVSCDDRRPIEDSIILEDIYATLETPNTFSVGKILYCVVGDCPDEDVSVIDHST